MSTTIVVPNQYGYDLVSRKNKKEDDHRTDQA